MKNEPWVKTGRSFYGIVKSHIYFGQHKLLPRLAFQKDKKKREKKSGRERVASSNNYYK
jgi:hypothetical protein